MSRELMCINTAADILKHEGKVFIGYVTAELEPYTAQQKPDISFIPRTGPSADRVFFVEYRTFNNEQIPQHYMRALREHKAFATEDAEWDFAGFAFATDANLQPDAVRQLAEDGIHCIVAVDSGELLAARILQWVSAPIEEISE